MRPPSPEFVTFTGVDAATDVSRLVEIQAAHAVEWGILFSPKRQGEGRYPPLAFVASLADKGLRLAAHVCGGHARDVLTGGDVRPLADLPSGTFSRVQVNTSDPSVDVGLVADFAASVGAGSAILQTRDGFPSERRVEWLYDVSGGRGVAPGSWPAPTPGHPRVGYAGGLGPGTVGEALLAIAASHPPDVPYWIDMENRVRTDDLLDLDLCMLVLEQVGRATGPGR